MRIGVWCHVCQSDVWKNYENKTQKIGNTLYSFDQLTNKFMLYSYCTIWCVSHDTKKWILKFQIYPPLWPHFCGYHVCLKKVSVSYNLKMFCFWNARIFWNMHNTSIKLLHIRVFTLFKNSWSIVGLGEKKNLTDDKSLWVWGIFICSEYSLPENTAQFDKL